MRGLRLCVRVVSGGAGHADGDTLSWGAKNRSTNGRLVHPHPELLGAGAVYGLNEAHGSRLALSIATECVRAP